MTYDILIILTSLFMLPVSNDKLSKHKPDNCTERVVKHIIKFKQSPSGEILRDLNKRRKRPAQNCACMIVIFLNLYPVNTPNGTSMMMLQVIC